LSITFKRNMPKLADKLAGMSDNPQPSVDYASLVRQIRQWGRELGFSAVGITDTDLAEAETDFLNWLGRGMHGDMDYMQRHGRKRSRPAQLVSGTTRIISVRMDYRPPGAHNSEDILGNSAKAFISRYALGRDYHKTLRSRLQKLATRIEQAVGKFGYRAFTDSAPVLEKPLAEKAGLGWIGKHSNVIHRNEGSWFFLGELFTDLPLPIDPPSARHCGSCDACMRACPTGAIVEPYTVDARLCISYLTIELRTSIPEKLRPLLGNRIYGCDDCQLVCPWNRFASDAACEDFGVRNGLDDVDLLDLFRWSENDFDLKLRGSPIRRIGHECWLRNIAVALGNGAGGAQVVDALQEKMKHSSAMVREHAQWALTRLSEKLP